MSRRPIRSKSASRRSAFAVPSVDDAVKHAGRHGLHGRLRRQLPARRAGRRRCSTRDESPSTSSRMPSLGRRRHPAAPPAHHGRPTSTNRSRSTRCSASSCSNGSRSTTRRSSASRATWTLRSPAAPSRRAVRGSPGPVEPSRPATGTTTAEPYHAGIFRAALGVDDTRASYEHLTGTGAVFDRPPMAGRALRHAGTGHVDHVHQRPERDPLRVRAAAARGVPLNEEPT